MSEIRPSTTRPEIQRPHTERPAKSERQSAERIAQQPAHKAETKHDVVLREAPKTDKPKGANVDITV
jgi:hypothetical protein